MEDNNKTSDKEDTFLVIEKVIKYIELRKIIKEERKEYKNKMKSYKEASNKMEEFLLDYLDKINEDYFQVGNKSRFVKTVKKSPIKLEDIAVSLLNSFEQYGLGDDVNENKKIISDILKCIDSKRSNKSSRYFKKYKI